jgi:pyrroline-5-carboxylate reductase
MKPPAFVNQSIHERKNRELKKCRVMIQYNSQISQYCGDGVDWNKDIADILEGMGFAFEVSEEDIEKVTAFSACGLGFAAYILGAFSAAGEKIGLPQELCREITKRTFTGAALSDDFTNMVSMVATKGGATERGIGYMKENRLEDIIENAVQCAYDSVK